MINTQRKVIMQTYLAYILDKNGYHDETTWADTEEQARSEIAQWYPDAESIVISQYESDPIIQELKNSFLVKDCGYSLELAAETYDDMNDTVYFTNALKDIA